MSKFITISVITTILVFSHVSANAQMADMPTLGGSDEIKPSNKLSTRQLPVIAEPELKNLTDDEKDAIGNIVNSVFVDGGASENKVEDVNVSSESQGKTINVTVDESGGGEVKATIEEAEAITNKSILDSKQEVAEKIELETSDSIEAQKEKVEVKIKTFKVDDIFNAEEDEKQEIKTEAITKNYDKQNNFNSNRNNSYAEVSVLTKPDFIEYDAVLDSNFRPTKNIRKSIITLNSEDYESSFNYESPYASLERIRNLPPKNRKLEVKNNINIERGSFTDPFYEEADISEVSVNNTIEDEIALEDFDLSDGDKPLDITNARVEKKQKTVSKKPKKFHFRDNGLVVSVKKKDMSLDGYYSLAKDALSIGQYESSITYFKEILKNNPKDKKTLFGLATAYHKAKQFDNAKKTYLEVIRVDKNYWPAVNNYIILVSQQTDGNAEEKLEELWLRNPDFASIPAQLGNINFEKGNLDKAIKFYAEAINLDKKNYTYLYNLAVILEKSGDKKSAATVYKNILEGSTDKDGLPESRQDIQSRYYQLIANR